VSPKARRTFGTAPAEKSHQRAPHEDGGAGSHYLEPERPPIRFGATPRAGRTGEPPAGPKARRWPPAGANPSAERGARLHRGWLDHLTALGYFRKPEGCNCAIEVSYALECRGRPHNYRCVRKCAVRSCHRSPAAAERSGLAKGFGSGMVSLWNRHGPPEDTFLGDTDPRSGPTQEKSCALWDAEQTCQRRGSNLSPRNGSPRRMRHWVDLLAGLGIGVRRFSKKPPGVTGQKFASWGL
jgi:hypothetical protein